MNTIIIANWKMELDLKESISLAHKIKRNLRRVAVNKEVVICRSFPALFGVTKILKRSKIKLGAQDVFWEEQGAYTGEVSPLMLKEIGCEYVILGHSERRQHLGETNEMIHLKTRVALKNSIVPVVCIGENAAERQDGQKDYVLLSQLSEIFQGIELERNQQLVVAYEPVWAISAGGGIAAEPAEIEYANEVIRHALLDLFDKELVNSNIRIIYGGSVKPENVKAFAKLKNVQGFLVGGASLNAAEFAEVVKKS
jgi:triosephosphate isomerase